MMQYTQTSLEAPQREKRKLIIILIIVVCVRLPNHKKQAPLRVIQYIQNIQYVDGKDVCMCAFPLKLIITAIIEGIKPHNPILTDMYLIASYNAPHLLK